MGGVKGMDFLFFGKRIAFVTGSGLMFMMGCVVEYFVLDSRGMGLRVWGFAIFEGRGRGDVRMRGWED